VNRYILANLLASAWTLVMGVAFVPLYLRHIHTEGYGLVGFFSSVTAVLSLVDVGLTIAVQREIARTSPSDQGAQKQLRDLIYSMEVLFWGVGAFLGLLLVALAPWFSLHWLKSGSLDPAVAARALQFLGASFMFQLPLSLYNGCLTGAQHHVRLSYISVTMSTLRSLGAALILTYVSSSLETFFAWQFFVSFLWTAVTRLAIGSALPGSVRKGTFSVTTLRRIGGFAAGVGGGNLLGILLLQVDKLVASQQLSLSELGRYTLAWTLASSLYKLTFPVFNAVYPRLVQLLTGGQQSELFQVYYRGCLAMSALLVPTSLLLSLFGREVVLAWLNNAELARQLLPVLACLALGVMCNGLCHIPYAVQLAHGSTRITLQTSLAALLLMLPATIWGAHHYGGVGVALAWLSVYALLVPAQFFTHRAFLPGQYLRWFFYCFLTPIAFSALAYGPPRWLFPASLPRPVLLIALALTLICNVGISAFLLYQVYRRRIAISRT